MGRGQRLAVIAAAIVVAVAAFIVLRPTDDEDGSSGSNTAQTTTTESSSGSEKPTAPPEPEPNTSTITLAHGQPAGGAKTIRAEKGEEVLIRVRSDGADELHLHGYDIKREVAPGGSATFRFTADLEGVFELEAHHAGDVPVAELVVEP